jgi:ubiquinone biosynthesis protein UbiJ
LRQRLASGLLHRIGREDQIASSHDGYVEIALRLASEVLAGAGRAAARRDAIRRAAPRLDGDVSVVEAFQRIVTDLTPAF